jgi:hypothetical protein
MAKLLLKIADRLTAQIALVRARRLVASAPTGALAHHRGGGRAAQSDTDSSAVVAPDLRARAEELADALRWTATHGVFKPLCLAQAIALREMLDNAGISGADIRVGVRREGDALKAHAWVRLNGRVLGDDPQHVRGFTEVNDIGVLGLR